MPFPPGEKKVLFHTLGCRLNFFESDGLFSSLSKHGYSVAAGEDIPDVVVVNTCTVTNKADSRNRNIIRNAIKRYPGAQVWVTGCYAQTDKESIESIPGIAGVIGNENKSDLPRLILEKEGSDFSHIQTVSDRFAYSDVLPNGHTRAYLKIQDGCDRQCSYCKIPQARGAGVSRNWKDVLDQVSFLQDNGVGEIILTGVNLGWYRDGEGRKAFPKMLEAILNKLEYSRLRLSSIEPPDVGVELAELLTHPRFTPFLHVPLQSGSKEILKRMKRSYTPETFRKRIELAKSKVPDLFLGTDVIVGFPGETEEDFQDSSSILEELGFSKIHAFPFSVRKNTSAEQFPETVSKEIKKERVHSLMHLSQRLHRKYAESQFSKKREAVLEGGGIAVTDNYLKAVIPESDLKSLSPGQFLTVEIGEYISDAADKEGKVSARILAAIG
ncbi:tRNA (N(6)-L-threonylcarbamoyladenosine(37)-C(2))-methylthiotransferase MtaB [Leptospira hartskeerlii]|uniref:tRNA (N(6)-L-threonylcarbamoyladenosine(37)-C(2))-methylthiotransferase MtaB n=1 Tax=Leptospira hartskeerlii TaxID=2023177 RepID=A0A2M9XI56_9LEPT|nr:tRNA (N(6)-L-threonylcarbamoyladenosine(37)-C(2))-methylthiotransferase MtaB [Leptospira hartskeerlii]PJZ27350.1 tRNA (N(6)-L-threonylcarbamoyladenosine(37)-C(2))-methylthiotransferase MtaB [Leptospira hartskeerlii]PJZ34011.1 tRNA (N(6)-L-threonylcarbamoyladenosine(37)-C(2))-methylthiotransferase MtaB [Leptospira hartskeerlii]